MRFKICLLVALLVTCSFVSFAGYRVGLFSSYQQLTTAVGENKSENSLVYYYGGLVFEADILDHLTLGVVVGYNHNHLDNPVDFYHLPLSLRLAGDKFNAVVLGLRMFSDVFARRNISLRTAGEVLYFTRAGQSLSIQLPIVAGMSTSENTFYRAGLEFLLRYNCFRGVTLFAGPQINLLKGQLKISENIERIEGHDTLDYKQKNALNLAVGFTAAGGKHLEIEVNVGLFSNTSLSVGIFYVF